MKSFNVLLVILGGTILMGCSTFTTIQPQGGPIVQANNGLAHISVHRVNAHIVPEKVRDESTPVYLQIKNISNQPVLASASHFTLTTSDGAIYQPIFVPPWQPTPAKEQSVQPNSAPPVGSPSPMLNQPGNPQLLPHQNHPDGENPPFEPNFEPPSSPQLEQPAHNQAVPPVLWKETKPPSNQVTEIGVDSSHTTASTNAFYLPDSDSAFTITQARFGSGGRGGFSGGGRGGFSSGYRGGFTSGYRGGFGGVRVAPPASHFSGRPGFYGRSWGGTYGGRPWGSAYVRRPWIGPRPWGYGTWPYYSRGWYRPYGYFGPYGWYPGVSLGIGIYGLPPFGVGMYGFPYYPQSSVYDEGEEPSIEQLMYQQSLPSITLRSGEQASGFVFFQKMNTHGNKVVYLNWEIHNEQNQVISRLQLPVTIEEDSE